MTQGTNETSQTDDSIIYLQVFITVGNVFLLPFIIISKVALKRTKKIPRIAKFLLNGLLSFDFFANLCFLLEKMILDDTMSRIFLLIGAGFAALSYVTIAMLSFDRLIVFQCPYQYLNLYASSKHKAQIVAITCWILTFLSHILHRVVLCPTADTSDTNNTSLSNNESCSSFMKWSNTPMTVTIPVIIISIACYIQIFRIVKRQANLISYQTKNLLKNYKSTTVIIIYMINIMVTATVYSCIAVIYMDQKYSILTINCVLLLNGAFNSCAYVLWFKECQMEFFKLFLYCFPSLKEKTYKMKIDIYFIPTVHKI